MQTLKTLELFSGILPSGDVVTLFTGNERAFDDADAAYLLAEYPERFERVAEERAPRAPSGMGLSADKPQPAAPPDASLETKMTDVPDDVEKFGATARRKKS